MSMTATQIVAIVAPDYATDARLSDFITLATSRTNRAYFGDNAQLAIALRAAHMICLSNRSGGDAGAISSKREGQLMVSYSNALNTKGLEDLTQTVYGWQLIGLIRGNGALIAVTGGNDDGVTGTIPTEV